MFGLTFEKLLLIAVLAAFIIGPERLPAAAQALARFVRGVKAMANGTKERMRDEMGPEFDDIDWKKLDPRQYDPRHIIREALEEPAPLAKPSVEQASASTISPVVESDGDRASAA
jgi:sec-independent protein translocase protein TatB